MLFQKNRRLQPPLSAYSFLSRRVPSCAKKSRWKCSTARISAELISILADCSNNPSSKTDPAAKDLLSSSKNFAQAASFGIRQATRREDAQTSACAECP